MSKIFEKNETLFTILLIVLYVVTNSYCMQNYGFTSLMSVIINTIFSVALIGLVIGLKRTKHYGLTRVKECKKFLYFIPLLLIGTVNLWNGINVNISLKEILFHVLTMINVGFIEEMIFRGFLFKMMEKDNLKRAMFVSALTFGIGHIVNLVNGAAIVPTLIQIAYAIALGYLFVVIFYKSKSIIPCVVTHAMINTLSIFQVEGIISLYVAPVALILIPIAYMIYMDKNVMEV